MHLKSRSTFPPGGFVFFQPETQWSAPYPLSDTFNKTVDRIRSHRVQNPRFNLSTDWSAIAHELEVFTCTRLKNNPNYCAQDVDTQKKTLFKTVPFKESAFGAVVRLVESVGKKFKGSKALIDWLGKGGLPVSPEIAQHRTNICLKCPLNEKGNWVDKVSGEVAEAIKAQREIKTGLNLRVQNESELGTCSACGCHLPLKVWVPIKVIKEHTDEETVKELHPSCWFHVEHYQELLLTIPFCTKDLDQAIWVLEWINELGGQPNHKCLLVADIKVPPQNRNKVLELAKKAFKQVELITTPYSLPNERWPLGPNWMFETTCKHVYEHYKQPFYFLEPDAIPLKKGWLDALEEEYNNCGKPFMGAVVSSSGQANLPGDHLTGVSINPWNAYILFRDIFKRPDAFDMCTAPIAVPLAHNSQQQVHFWGQPTLPPTFRRERGPDTPDNALLFGFIPRKGSVFHRNKDGSLIKLLRENLKK